MKKFIVVFSMLFITLGMFGQPMIGRQVIDMSQYGGIESFPLEMVYFHTDREIDNDSIYSLGGGYYMTKISGVPDFTVKFNFDRSKAIIVGHQPFFMYSEFVVRDDDKRLVLYNEKPYFGFIYDKKYKVLQYFTSKKHYRKFIRRNPGFGGQRNK
jgi:hypothetical protein